MYFSILLQFYSFPANVVMSICVMHGYLFLPESIFPVGMLPPRASLAQSSISFIHRQQFASQRIPHPMQPSPILAIRDLALNS